MKSITIKGAGIEAPAIVTGVMRIQEKSDAEVRALFDASLESGIDFFDHADLYGFNHLRFTPNRGGFLMPLLG